ncbi:MAG TPA: PilZ domain-containing protein [Thermoanaerobaculia bacterium]|jgi:hypothetical protein|nr:PilZ domain-containing protein [Thermoanaerobaculia bacterium]
MSDSDPLQQEAEDRRRHPRYDVSDLPGVLDGFRTFETLKLSAGGALIRVPVELALEQRVHVTLELDEGPFRSPAYVVFLGPDFSSHEVFRIGLAFADTAAEDQARLQRFIERALAAGGLS